MSASVLPPHLCAALGADRFSFLPLQRREHLVHGIEGAIVRPIACGREACIDGPTLRGRVFVVRRWKLRDDVYYAPRNLEFNLIAASETGSAAYAWRYDKVSFLFDGDGHGG